MRNRKACVLVFAHRGQTGPDSARAYCRKQEILVYMPKKKWLKMWVGKKALSFELQLTCELQVCCIVAWNHWDDNDLLLAPSWRVIPYLSLQDSRGSWLRISWVRFFSIASHCPSNWSGTPFGWLLCTNGKSSFRHLTCTAEVRESACIPAAWFCFCSSCCPT